MEIHSFGSFAARLLSRESQGHVAGATSNGLFLQVNSSALFFLSRERYRGPFTMNVRGSMASLTGIAVSSRFRVAGKSLIFPEDSSQIPFDCAVTWLPPIPNQNILSKEERMVHLLSMAGLLSLPPGLIEPFEMKEIESALENNDIPRIISSALVLLGRGPGLTPAGDDFLLGFLLTMNRWRSILPGWLDVKAVGNPLERAVREKTTLLSASLIQAAISGEADERLITALDSLVTGIPSIAVCEANLRAWGHTSGASAFHGMRLALMLADGQKV